MKHALLSIARRWDRFGRKISNWRTSGDGLSRAFKTIPALIGLIIFVEIFSTLFGLSMLFLPKFTSILLAICILFSFGAILFTPIMMVTGIIWQFCKRLNESIWLLAITASIFLTFFCVLLGFFDAHGFFGIQRAISSRFITDNTRFPISDPQGFAVDSKGNIYLAISCYPRVQVYNKEGDFQRGWFIDAGGGAFDLWIEEGDLLHVCTSRTDLHLIYNREGRLLESTSIKSFDQDVSLFKKAGGLDELNTFGDTYSISSPNWSPKVTRTNVEGEQAIVIQDPFCYWILRKMSPMILIVLAGLIMSCVLWLIIKLNVDFNDNKNGTDLSDNREAPVQSQ